MNKTFISDINGTLNSTKRFIYYDNLIFNDTTKIVYLNQNILEAITMKMNNNIKLNKEYDLDIEFLRIEKLIEEQKAYEKEFLSLEHSTEEFDFQISEYELEIMELKGLHDPFEYEDRQNQSRDNKLIEEREAYELVCSDILLDEFSLNDLYDFQIDAMEETELIMEEQYYEDFQYHHYEEEMFWKLHYLKQSQFEEPKCTCAYMDYMPHDDLCDYLDCYDYPEGPDENLNGIKLF